MADFVENDAGGEKLVARELPSAVNSSELLAAHAAVNGTKVRTRFPPEPNGYLHVGHAKSMNMNFQLAFEKLGVAVEDRETIFRYDDTNPEAESNEYIQSLREDVDWMGWKPVRVTYTSDYFDKLYELAIELIKRDKAYVCHQSKADIEASRNIARAKASDPNAPGDPCSPWRNRPIEESLREFENMRKGKYAGNEATLRMKMDMYSPNPNMWDQVAYRIKYVPHPHAGNKWCIYPTYDYTHCIIDSLEHIDYSICTLEFETRRESYYWVLEALDLYRPKVFEMSRLNISYTVLSKRKLLKLVNNGYMRGWDDPRMPTIKGLRRRGYTASIMNTFCCEIGVTRNFNIVQYERLAAVARNQLNEHAVRVMAVLKPLKIILTGYDFTANPLIMNIPNFPFDLTRGSHTLTLSENVIYIDSNDFRLEDTKDYFGLAPGKQVSLKYTGFRIECVEVLEYDGNGVPSVLQCHVYSNETDAAVVKPKGTIQWVPASTAIPFEARLYSHLFISDEPNDDNWEKELNPESEVVLTSALMDPSVMSLLLSNNMKEHHIQCERIGYFVLDKDTVLKEEDHTVEKLVYNLTVGLKDSKPTDHTTNNTNNDNTGDNSRKEKQDRQLAEKLARMHVNPKDMFTAQVTLYSAFDEDGIPTHDVTGEKISKSGYKKLRKEWEKQKQLFESSANKK